MPENKNWFTRHRQKLAFGMQVLGFIFVLSFYLGTAFLGFEFKQVSAQIPGSILLQAPDISSFPEITIQFKLPSGLEDEGLQVTRERLTVLEGDSAVEVIALEEHQVGVLFSLAINGARDFDLRDAEGVSVYQQISAALADWASRRQFAPQDSWSLITTEGTLVRNLQSPDPWLTAFTAYQPNFRSMTPDLSSLETAIRSSADRVVPFGADKVVLYLTVPPLADQISTLYGLTEEARAAGVQVNVWMVGDALFLDNAQGQALFDLADITGGDFFYEGGEEPLPDPETYLDSLGSSYTLTYRSGIRETGTYPLAVELALSEGVIRGESTPLYIEVFPPEPILISPPTVINREILSDGEALTPGAIDIQYLVEYADEHPREIATSRLLVDGEVVAESDQPPFESLTWDLSGFDQAGEHQIQVEVVDEIGLTGRTILTPVQIEVTASELDADTNLDRKVLFGVIVMMSVAVLILLIWLGRRGWKSPVSKRIRKTLSSLTTQPSQDRVTLTPSAKQAYAILIPLGMPEEDDSSQTFKISQPRVVVGRDPDQADLVLEGSDIAQTSAVIQHWEGLTWLLDMGSSGGTWVNYQRVGRRPVQIEHGDLIHFGELGFRFTMVDSDTHQKVNVSKYHPIL
jgi:hypothetical protein